jgi:hypothetical protein
MHGITVKKSRLPHHFLQNQIFRAVGLSLLELLRKLREVSGTSDTASAFSVGVLQLPGTQGAQLQGLPGTTSRTSAGLGGPTAVGSVAATAAAATAATARGASELSFGSDEIADRWYDKGPVDALWAARLVQLLMAGLRRSEHWSAILEIGEGIGGCVSERESAAGIQVQFRQSHKHAMHASNKQGYIDVSI